MNVQISRIPLQRIVWALPKRLRRIRVAQLLASMTGSPYHRVKFAGGEIVGNVRDGSVANSLVRGTTADYGYFRLAGDLLRTGDVHVDLGANYGFYTFGLMQSSISPTVGYVLIDANPDCIACLRETVRLHPRLSVKIIHAAAAQVAGDIAFTFAPAETGVGRVGTSAGTGIQIQVPALPLDELFTANGIDNIALLKMDIEGSETSAMRGLSGMLSAHRVDVVYFEVNPQCLERQQSDPQALFDEFTRHGYRLYWPHDDIDWIERTYGFRPASAAQPQRSIIRRNQPHAVIAFDPARYENERFGQCDLLAVSPNCRVENAADPG